MHKTINTHDEVLLQKYDDKYGLFIACVMNRLFCYDISQQILNFI